MGMGKGLGIAVATVALLAAAASAQAASWKLLGSQSDKRPYESIAQVLKTGVPNVHGVRVAASPAGAKVGGEVMCTVGSVVNSSTFGYVVGRTRVRVLKATGTCTVAAEATLRRGGVVSVTVWVR